jgi:hypothetical protein
VRKAKHNNNLKKCVIDFIVFCRYHEWLRGVDWTAVKEKSIASPLSHWIPKKSSMPDTRNFDLYQLYEKSATSDSPHVSPRVREEMFSGY